MEETESLEALVAASEHVQLGHLAESYPVLHITHPSAEAKLALHGAHLISWTPEGEKPVIYTSPAAVFQNGKAIRGGIPLCWPWFNAHPTDPEKPSHGVARTNVWQLDSIKETEEKVSLIFSLPDSKSLQELVGHPFKLILKLDIGKELRVHMMTENTGPEPIWIGGAIHSYFSVSNAHEVSLEGLDSIEFIDTTGEETIQTQNGAVTISGEVDSIYVETSDTVVLKDPKWNRQINIGKSGSATTVIWNPGPENAQKLSDLPDDGYLDFVCVEAANARRDIYSLDPGQLHCLVQTVSVSPLEA